MDLTIAYCIIYNNILNLCSEQSYLFDIYAIGILFAACATQNNTYNSVFNDTFPVKSAVNLIFIVQDISKKADVANCRKRSLYQFI